MGWGLHAWAQAKTDTEDPRLDKPGGAYRQLRERAVGSAIALGVLVTALVVVGWLAG